MIIAIDYDGTIADTNRDKSKWIKAKLGKDIATWLCNRSDCEPIIGHEKYEEMAAHVYGRERSLAAVEVPGAMDAIRDLAGSAEVHVVTARSPERIEYAREWLSGKNLLTCIKDVRSSAGSSKGRVCSDIGAHALIDDDRRHLEKRDVAWLHRLLLQHGRTEPVERAAGVEFCGSWDEALRILKATGQID